MKSPRINRKRSYTVVLEDVHDSMRTALFDVMINGSAGEKWG